MSIKSNSHKILIITIIIFLLFCINRGLAANDNYYREINLEADGRYYLSNIYSGEYIISTKISGDAERATFSVFDSQTDIKNKTNNCSILSAYAMVIIYYLTFMTMSARYAVNTPILLENSSYSVNNIAYADYSLSDTDYEEAANQIRNGEFRISDENASIHNIVRKGNEVSFDFAKKVM